ncbi:MAG: hypothetical protein J0M24_28055 [Verrucomicrobia bacterium]|nr:hypothetical protein [Verrucomicrobiota bacterium]
MSIPHIIDRFVEFSFVLANILVFKFAIVGYQNTKKRSLLMIAISSAIATILHVAPWIRADEPSLSFWSFYTVATMCDLSLYVAGFWLLTKDYVSSLTVAAQLGAAPNSGLAPSVHNPNDSGGPPSVS